jgi:DNA mismatch repair protein MutH
MNSDHHADRLDKASVASIVGFSRRLTGRSLEEARPGIAEEINKSNKGDLGSLVERYYFEHVPAGNHGPDFAEAGLELKTTGVMRNGAGFGAKERLVLSMINYETIVDEEWETSSLLAKCRLMLLLFYEYDKSAPVTERRFVLDPLLVHIPGPQYRTSQHDVEFITSHALALSGPDLARIRRDWEEIRDKVRAGRAHELSEGDTEFLGASRKGSGGPHEPLRNQPFSTEGAKARAFALKQGFVTSLIAQHVGTTSEAYDRPTRVSAWASTDKAVLTARPPRAEIAVRFEPFLGLTLDEISARLGITRTAPEPKNFKRLLADAILRTGGGDISDLQKADTEMKTILLKADGIPQEDMSFPGFRYLDIAGQEWEDSEFFKRTERRFLFIVFQKDRTGTVRLLRSLFWNMPADDRKEAQRVFEETKKRVAAGSHDLPRSTESRVAHVRPKARNARDTLPYPDGSTDVKKCFWLNKSYIARVMG